MLVEKYHAPNGSDKSIVGAIDRTVSASSELLSKKELIDAILPPVRRFGGGRAEKKRTVIEKLKTFFEKFMGLVEA